MKYSRWTGIIGGAGVALIALAMGGAAALAAPLPTLTAPLTHGYAYPNCPAAPTSETITITGIAPLQQLKGQILAEYINPSSPTGLSPIPGNGTNGVIPVAINGANGSSATISVQYPSADQWVSFPVTNPTTGEVTGTREIHIGIQIEVWEADANGALILIGSVGPGQDWDVYCVGNPPPPPPPPPSGFAPRTIGYWKTHSKLWPTLPTTGLSWGCAGTADDLSMAAALNVLKSANARDMSVMLAAQLIAAKLNVISGSSPSAIGGTITAADAWLCSRESATAPKGIGSDPQGTDRTFAEALKSTLDAWNNSAGG